ncbi:hypothetical protein MASR1M8_03680 [Thermomonas brevis]
MATDEGAGETRAAVYCWTFGNAEFDEARWQLRVAGQDVELEHKPLEVLQYLLRHAGEAVTKDELLSSVWAGRVVVEAVLTNAVGKLRRALGEQAQDVVATLPRVGYRLGVPASRRSVEFLPDASRLETGDSVPRRPNWKLESPLARTGSNEVWLARHAKTREARVFKFSLTGRGLAGLKREVTVSRLLHEALGERADFVHVLDWDFELAPYFVESQFGGTSLDRWPDEAGIGKVPRELRLSLFAQAAEAVGAAHGVGVLHKDIKPANLLVEGVGESARIRVADFGSSRLFDSGVIDELGITRLGLTQTQTISSDSGTPLYLAPEVAAGQSATISSDVYALGVTLYQLLVGDFRRPLAPGWESDIEDPLLRQDIADAANGDPAKRLDSASELAERIRSLAARREKRALELAVQARIADGEKRLAKARARRPWMIAAMLLLGSGLLASLYYGKRAQDAEVVAQTEAARSNASLDAQTALNTFLTEDVIGAAAPDKNKGKQPTVLEALDVAAAGVDARFKGDAGTAGTIHLALARAYQAIARIEQSERHFASASPLLEKAFGATDERSYDALLGRAHMLIELGTLDDAEKRLGMVRSRLQATKAVTPETRYRYGHTLAYLYERKSDFKAAADEYRKLVALALGHRELGEERLLKSRAELGNALLAIGKSAEAVDQMKQSLIGLEKLNGRRNSRTLQARQFLVQALMQVNKHEEALQQLQLLEEDLVHVLGTKHPQLANVNTLRAIALVSKDRFAEAATEYGKANQLFEETIGRDSPFTLSTLQYRGEALRWAGRSEEAVHALGTRLQDARRVFGDPSPAFAEYAIILAMARVDVGDTKGARSLASYIHAADGKIPDDANSQRVPYLRLLEGRLRQVEGDKPGALEKYREALKVLPIPSDYSKEIERHIADSDS